MEKILDFPDEILDYIFRFIPASEALALRYVCKRFKNVYYVCKLGFPPRSDKNVAMERSAATGNLEYMIWLYSKYSYNIKHDMHCIYDIVKDDTRILKWLIERGYKPLPKIFPITYNKKRKRGYNV